MCRVMCRVMCRIMCRIMCCVMVSYNVSCNMSCNVSCNVSYNVSCNMSYNQQIKFAFYGIKIRLETPDIEILSVALLSKFGVLHCITDSENRNIALVGEAKKSECCTAQHSLKSKFGIAQSISKNKWGARKIARGQTIN